MHQNLPDSAIIIGAGIGGLSMGILLAGLGVEVTVLEKNSCPGGLVRSYRRQGIACEVGVHYLGSLDNGQVLKKFFDYLGVTEDVKVSRMGENGIIDRYLFSSPHSPLPSFNLPSGLDHLEENLCRSFPDDVSTVTRVMADIRQATRQLHELDLLYGIDNDFSLLDQSEPMGKILDSLGCSPGLRSVLAIAASWIGVPLDDCPAYYHNMALGSYVSSSYRLQGNGADLADVFARRLQDLGGRILLSQEVADVLVETRTVTGIQLKSGETLAATLVIGAVHPQVMLAMLPEGSVKPSYQKRISGLVNTHGIFSVHAAVDSTKHPEIPYNIFKIDTDQAGNMQDLRYYQIRQSADPTKNVFSLLTSGRDKLWIPWANTITGKRGSAYRRAKKELAEDLLEEAEELFGQLHGLQLLDAYTPLTIRDWVNSPGGSAYGVQRSSSQILGTALLNRTAVKGLYLAGQNVMAPGIIGTILGSFSTLKLILGTEDFKQQIVL